jgi:hypothetical protein
LEYAPLQGFAFRIHAQRQKLPLEDAFRSAHQMPRRLLAGGSVEGVRGRRIPQLLKRTLSPPRSNKPPAYATNLLVRSCEESGPARNLGTVEPGKLADVIVVAGDPNFDIVAPSHVETVVKVGEVVKGNVYSSEVTLPWFSRPRDTFSSRQSQSVHARIQGDFAALA